MAGACAGTVASTASRSQPGVYLIQAQVNDRAGNRGLSAVEFEPGAVEGRPGLTVRGITAQPPVRPVTAGGRTEFFVDARGAEYRWKVRRVGQGRIIKGGTAKDPSLVFRAPEGFSGAYLLELRAGRWSTTVPFLVQAKERAKVLVVMPTLSWIGSDKIDDNPFDGLPNTLATGDKVRWPRMYSGEKGLPAGFADNIAPLLVFLDRRKIRYDLTSDIDLDLTRNPRATDREGVLLAGSLTWVTRSLGQRLRKYVTDGGKLAVFGSDTLRRGVRLRVLNDEDAGTLERPTQPAAADPFGTRVAKERRVRHGRPARPVRAGGHVVRPDGGRARPPRVHALRGGELARQGQGAGGDRPAAHAAGGARGLADGQARARDPLVALGRPARQGHRHPRRASGVAAAAG